MTLHETTNSTGTQYYTKPTLIGHLLAHIENARKVFDIKSQWYGGSHGLEYDKRFPKYLFDICKKLDEKYSTNQSREYSYRNMPIPTHEAIYNDGESNCGDWPSRNYDGDMDMNEKDQIRIWISNLDYMLRDCAITYTARLRDEKDNDRRDMLTLRVIELWDFHTEFERGQQEHYRKQVETPQWKIDWLVERGWLLMAVSEEKGVTVSFKRHDADKNAPETVINGATIKEVMEDIFTFVSSKEYAKEKAERELKLESA